LKYLLSSTLLFVWLSLNAQFANKIASLSHLPENSGLEFTDGRLWAMEDSGNPSQLYAIDTATGAILQTVVVDNVTNVDWEDITADKEYIYVGDFGNNNGTRTNLKILRIKKSEIGTNSDVTISSEAILFEYADQTDFSSNSNTNFDCEAMVSIGDSLYLFTKNRGDAKTRVYALPKVVNQTFALQPLVTINVEGMITAADYDSASKTIMLLGYGGFDINPFLYEIKGVQPQPFSSTSEKRTLISNNILGWQTEGLAFIDSGNIFISNEYTSFVRASLYRLSLDETNTTGISQIATNSVQCFPNPTANMLEINSREVIENVKIWNSQGVFVYQEDVNAFETKLFLKQKGLKKGLYFLEITSQNNAWVKRIVLE
jgi:hypothetical protein